MKPNKNIKDAQTLASFQINQLRITREGQLKVYKIGHQQEQKKIFSKLRSLSFSPLC